MGVKKVMAFHSYKGGTGKTTCVVNLAALYASMGKKVCLIDFDVYAPSLTSYFGVSPKYFIHDLLSGDAGIHEVLIDYSRKLGLSGELHIAFSSPAKEDIRPVSIGDFCFLPLHTFVYPGVTIGDGVVARVGTHINFDVPPFCLVTGNPARIVKKLDIPHDIIKLVGRERYESYLEAHRILTLG